MINDYLFLADYIPYGRENAISTARLAARLDMSVRQMRRLIHEARVNGMLILSGNPGYWRSDDLEELKAFYKRMRHLGIGTFSAAKVARLKIKELEGKARE